MRKYYHLKKIDPYNINLFIERLFNLLKDRKLDNLLIKENKSLLIKFHDVDYALHFNEYKHDKSKTILSTFFIIESKIPDSQKYVEKINKSQSVQLDDNLSIYVRLQA